MQKYNHILYGLFAGLIGGLAGALILWGSWLLPALGLLLTRADLINGLATMLALGLIGGALYAAVIGRRDLRIGGSVASGLALGAVLWIAGPLVLVPMGLGFPPQTGNPLDHLTPLAAFLVYGALTGLVYGRTSLKQGRMTTYSAAVLLLLSIAAVPIMLRMATSTDPRALQLPDGYHAEVVAKGFTYPTSIVVAEDGTVYVGESGFTYGPKTTEAKVLSVSSEGEVSEVARGFEGPLNGLELREDELYVSHLGKITRVNLLTDQRENLVTNIPALGDHQNNDLLFDPDGTLYFTVGAATNAAVVGSDNFVYAWADRYPDFCDQPSREFTLTGENYPALDLKSPDPQDEKSTGAFAPFGTTRGEGETVEATIPASAAIHSLAGDGTLTVHADGLRNPYGLAITDDGAMYATNLGYDDRGVRAVRGSPDWVVEIREGAWYGWPDYAGTIPLTDRQFSSDRGINLNPLIADAPKPEPPLASLPPHYSPMKLCEAPTGFDADGLLVAIFGDAQPLTEDLDEAVPTGILRVSRETGDWEWFIRNHDRPRYGRAEGGFKRVIDVKPGPDGTDLYVLDFGVMEFTDMSPNAIPETGVLWRITRAGDS